ncbi:MAG: hypothetical protein AAF467_09885 [Actinomycetota bacterium]
MTPDDALDLIRDVAATGRDIHIDELGDALSAGRVRPSAIRSVLLDLIDVARAEADLLVQESIMNVLSANYLSGMCRAEIEELVVELGPSFAPMSAVHAVSIIAESALPDRGALLSFYANSENPAVRESAERYMSD